MSAFDRADYSKMLARQLAENIKRKPPGIAQAPILPENLTGSAEWDFFLSLVQSRRNEVEALMNQSRDMALSGQPSAARETAYVRYREWCWALRELDFILALPKQAIEQAQPTV